MNEIMQIARKALTIAHLIVCLSLCTASVSRADELPLGHSSPPIMFKVDGLRSGKGFVAMSVFEKTSAKEFPSNDKKAVRTFYVPLNGKTEVEIPVDGLPPGEYAVSVMHDEAADHKMHFNLIGIPVEGFGFSNNPTVYFGPPSFKRAQLHVDESSTTTAVRFEIKMKYYL